MASDSDATEWEKTRRGLLAPLQLAVVDDSEERGLDLLTDTVVNSNACALLEADIPFADITRITRSYTKPKMEVLNSHSVVVCKIDDEVEALLDVSATVWKRMMQPHDGHLDITVRNRSLGFRAKVCIVGMRNVPATDNCAAFVLWAENGYPEMPQGMMRTISFVRSPIDFVKREGESRKLLLEQAHERARVADAIADADIRIGLLSWEELIVEHEAAKVPSDEIEAAAFAIRQELLKCE